MKNKESCSMQRSKKVRKGDKVVVLAGNCKGQSAPVVAVSGEYVLLQGLNLKKRHVKPSQANPKGGVIEIEGKIHISNVRVCDEAGKPLKLKVEATNEGRRLYYTNGQERVVYRNMKSAK